MGIGFKFSEFTVEDDNALCEAFCAVTTPGNDLILGGNKNRQTIRVSLTTFAGHVELRAGSNSGPLLLQADGVGPGFVINSLEIKGFFNRHILTGELWLSTKVDGQIFIVAMNCGECYEYIR